MGIHYCGVHVDTGCLPITIINNIHEMNSLKGNSLILHNYLLIENVFISKFSFTYNSEADNAVCYLDM